MKIARARLRRLATRLALVLVLLLALAVVAAKPAASAFGHWLAFEKADFERVDAIVVLGGAVPDRPLEARDLYREKKSPQIILICERRGPWLEDLDELGIHVPGDCDLRRQVLEKQGVPPEAIVQIPAEVTSTWEEAVAFAQYAADNGIKSAVVVTSKYHARRSYLNFTRACAGQGIEIYMKPSKYCLFDPSGWWRERDQLKRVYIETANLTAYYLGFR
ncbi:MAG TPA: YdcF family protein [Acidobacteriota bacterium]|nr:YdcF family protein [Acidobacteriota bacterium]